MAGSITNAITLNRYAYANGNPVSNVDPFGLSAERGGNSSNKNFSPIAFGVDDGIVYPKSWFKKRKSIDYGTISLSDNEYIKDTGEDIIIDINNISPGTLFDTMDEAAVAFAHYINATSISENREYASFIYSLKVLEDSSITISNPSTNDGNLSSVLWNIIFDGEPTKTFTVVEVVTKYSYVNPKSGKSNSVHMPINWFWLHNKEAEIHTHARYRTDDSLEFSPYDYNNWINYLVTPAGTVRKYDPKYDKPDESSEIIYSSAPSDPNYSDKK